MPVGCVPSTAVAISGEEGVCLRGGVKKNENESSVKCLKSLVA